MGMFLFAIVMSTGLWVYWYFHTKPFQAFQLAIAQAFPKSYPRVEGGQQRIHKGTPRILRVTMKVPFNPKDETAEQQVQSVMTRLEQLAQQHTEFASYDRFEVHLVQPQPEHASHVRAITREIVQPSRL